MDSILEQQGVIRFLDSERGFGFITSQSGDDLFFHHSHVMERAFASLQIGDLVGFNMVKTGRGPNAICVTRQDA